MPIPLMLSLLLLQVSFTTSIFHPLGCSLCQPLLTCHSLTIGKLSNWVLIFATYIHMSIGWAFWPVLLIANIAALIASRTMTTATFSCIKQSAALGCFPRLKIIHTSRKYMGKIYIPVLNWFLLAFSLVLVCSISNINEIGNAYGNDCFYSSCDLASSTDVLELGWSSTIYYL